MDSDQQQPPQMPADTGAAPAQQPYQPPQQPVQPASSYPPPPPQSRGFNWLACCGITCAVLLIIGGVVGYCTYRFAQPFLNIGMQMVQVAETVEATDIATIKAEAMETDAQALAANPTIYKGKWLVIEGAITSQSGPMGEMQGAFGAEDATSYVLADNVMVLDISQQAPVGGVGDRIRAYGQCMVWDLMELEKLPFIGKQIAEDLASEPALQGKTMMIFVVAKEVTRISIGDGAAAESTDPAADQETTDDSGWLR
jgi:hypothetical protein